MIKKREKINKKVIIREIEKNGEKLRENGVRKMGIFGSYLREKQTPRSDIDILVEFKETSSDNFFGLLFFLENLFKKKIDLIEIKNLRNELKNVLEEAEYVKI